MLLFRSYGYGIYGPAPESEFVRIPEGWDFLAVTSPGYDWLSVLGFNDTIM